jgi:16S rRNA (cytidine1402-2'-O)-methyltransferase
MINNWLINSNPRLFDLRFMTQSNPSAPCYVIDANSFSAQPIAPGLHITATPIGNLADITLRALNTLAAADIIFCEDTRITSRLLNRFQIVTPLKPYHDHNGAKVRPRIIAAVKAGKAVALVSDAGTPLICDPGFKLVHQLRAQNLPVHMSPGVSAPIMALALSGFPSDRFQFCGFLPPKTGARQKALAAAGKYGGVTLFFESPKRLIKCLADIARTLPGAEVAIGRELTKKFEEIVSGSGETLLQAFSGRQTVKGEITIAIWPGKPQQPAPDDEEVLEHLREAVKTMPAAKAALEVARKFSLHKRDLYDAAVGFKKSGGQ